MGIRTALRTIVLADKQAQNPLLSAGVLALLGNPPRMYSIHIPQGVLTTTVTSALAFQIIDNISDKNLKGVATLFKNRMQFTIWARDVSVASSIFHALQLLLDGYGNAVVGDTYIDRIFHLGDHDDREPESQYYKIYVDYRIIWRLA